MRIKLNSEQYFILYFFLLMVLYHYKIKYYFYWLYIEELLGKNFNFSFLSFLLATTIFSVDLYLLSTIKKTRLIYIVLSIFFALLTIPSLIASTSSQIYPFKLILFHQAFFIFLFCLSKVKFNFNSIPSLNKVQALYLLVGFTTLGILPYLLVYGPHINLKNLFLIDVYQTRFKMAGLSNPYFGYTYSIFTKIIIPLIIVFGLELKKKLWVFLGAFYLILFYLFGAHKTVYVGLVVVLVFYRFSFEQSVKFIVKYSSLLLVAVIIIAFFGFDYPWILSFRRVHFIPTLLDICYLDFFDGNFMYWSESVLKSIMDYPYDMRATNLIGKEYFNRPDMSANNGLISEGYMNFGGLGVLLNLFIVSIYFAILNSLKIPSKYFGLFILTIFSFLSSSVFTVLLTHGGFALLLISIFILKSKGLAQNNPIRINSVNKINT